MEKNSEDKKSEVIYPIYADNVSVKKLLHPKLVGYYEFEMTRIAFQSEIDFKLYKAVEKNDSEDVEKMFRSGHSPDRFFKREIVRLITSDRVNIVDFEKFKVDVKAYEDIQTSKPNISIVEKIQDSKSLMSLALEKKAYNVVDTLVKHGCDLDLKDETIRLLSDYKERLDSPSNSTLRLDYINVETSEKTLTPIVGNLVYRNDINSIKHLVEDLKAQIDFNSPQIHKKEVSTKDPSRTDLSRSNSIQSLSFEMRPLDLAVENKLGEMAKYLKDNGADIKLMSKDLRKVYRNLERDFQDLKSITTPSQIEQKMLRKTDKSDRSL